MKRKMFRRLMAASLTTVMIAGLVGCGSNPGTSESSGSSESGSSESSKQSESSSEGSESTSEAPSESESEGNVEKYTPLTDENGNVYDLGGMEVTIYSWFDDAGNQTGAYGEACQEWREWVQETYNFKMVWDTSHGWGGTSDDFSNYVTTNGDDNNYIFCMANRPDLTSFMNNGLMYDLATLDCLDFSDRKYSLNAVHEFFAKGNSIYAFSSGFPEAREGIFFNKRLLEETTGKNADYIYDLQKNNEWNWSALEDLLKQIQANGDVDGDGVTDIYGISGNTGSWVTDIVFSNGGRWFDRDADGKLVCTAQDPKTVEAFEFAKRIMESDYWYKNPYTGDEAGTHWDYFFDAFSKEEKYVFLPESAYNMTGNNRFSKAADEPSAADFGFVMIPKSDSMSEYTNKYSDNVYAIPACYDADKAWKIAFAYDQFFELVPGYEDFNPGLSGYMAGASDSREVDETIARMSSEGGCVDLTSLVPGVNIGEDLQWFSADYDVSALIEATITKWQTAVDEANK